MYWMYLKPFLAIWVLLLVCLFIHIGYINSRWKIWQWPEAAFFVAFRDSKTRDDFWHMVINAALIAAFIVLILYALGKLHNV
jgi:protein tyrosine phosphatase